MAVDALKDFEHLVVVGTRPPVGFFAYPGSRACSWNPETTVTVLATPDEDALGALQAVADLVGADAQAQSPPAPGAAVRSALDFDTLTRAIPALLPEGAVVVDESVTASAFIQPHLAGAADHDWLSLTGGAIGWGLPAATGAAIGAPDRPVISLEADGSAMYTIQALWTQAREQLDVTTIVIANRSYAILEFEFSRVDAEGDGAAAHALMDLYAAGAVVHRARGIAGRARAAGRGRRVLGRGGRPSAERARTTPDRGGDLDACVGDRRGVRNRGGGRLAPARGG